MSKAVQAVGRQAVACSILLASVLGIAACGGKADKPQASQTAASVNGEDVTVHQINHVLEQRRGLRPEQTDAVSRQILERLIDQTLAVQKARELELDRDPRVVLSIEVAKREILARAYAERLGRGVIKPSSEDVRKYHDAHPELFAERKVFTLDEFYVRTPTDKLDELESLMQGSMGAAAFGAKLKARGTDFSAKQNVRAAEQLPGSLLRSLVELKPGTGMLMPVDEGARVIFVSDALLQPVTAQVAAPAIEAYLSEERRREAVSRGARDMRGAAKIEYVGRFAERRDSIPSQVMTEGVTEVAPSASNGR